MGIATDSWKLNQAKILRLPNGVDCEQYDCEGDPSAAPNFDRQADELILGTIAPLRKEKNLHRLLRVFAASVHHHNIRLLIAGDGVERKPLEEYAADLGIKDKVIFAGHVETPEKNLSVDGCFCDHF